MGVWFCANRCREQAAIYIKSPMNMQEEIRDMPRTELISHWTALFLQDFVPGTYLLLHSMASRSHYFKIYIVENNSWMLNRHEHLLIFMLTQYICEKAVLSRAATCSWIQGLDQQESNRQTKWFEKYLTNGLYLITDSNNFQLTSSYLLEFGFAD